MHTVAISHRSRFEDLKGMKDGTLQSCKGKESNSGRRESPKKRYATDQTDWGRLQAHPEKSDLQSPLRNSLPLGGAGLDLTNPNSNGE